MIFVGLVFSLRVPLWSLLENPQRFCNAASANPPAAFPCLAIDLSADQTPGTPPPQRYLNALEVGEQVGHLVPGLPWRRSLRPLGPAPLLVLFPVAVSRSCAVLRMAYRFARFSRRLALLAIPTEHLGSVGIAAPQPCSRQRLDSPFLCLCSIISSTASPITAITRDVGDYRGPQIGAVLARLGGIPGDLGRAFSAAYLSPHGLN